jgi:hypothetical protein
MDAVVFKDTLGIAGDLDQVLAALAPYDQSTIKGIIHRKPPNGIGGKFEWVEAVAPPLDMAEIAGSLKARFGGGDYRLTIFAEGKTRKVIEFPIMADPAAGLRPVTPANDQATGGDRMMMMMMQMQAEARRDQADRDAEARREAREADERRETRDARRDEKMMAVLGIAVPIVAPLLLGNRDKLQDQIALFTALKGDGNNMKETAEMMLTMKKLFGDDKGGEGFNPDDIAGSLARLAGPAAAALGRAFAPGRGPPAGGEEAPGEGQLYLPEPTPAAPAPILAAPGAPLAPPSDPVLALIKPHVLYMFSTRAEPGLAADHIADIMEREGVGEGDVLGLVAAFTSSADWQADLAAQGIDLRSDPRWADDFLSELIAAWTDPDRVGDGGAGGGGGAPDASHDAGLGAGGLRLDAGAGEGAGADKPRVRRPKGLASEG